MMKQEHGSGNAYFNNWYLKLFIRKFGDKSGQDIFCLFTKEYEKLLNTEKKAYNYNNKETMEIVALYQTLLIKRISWELTESMIKETINFYLDNKRKKYNDYYVKIDHSTIPNLRRQNVRNIGLENMSFAANISLNTLKKHHCMILLPLFDEIEKNYQYS